MLPDPPPGLSRPTSSLSRPCGLTSTGSLNVTVNRIVSYKRYVSPDCGADATITDSTTSGMAALGTTASDASDHSLSRSPFFARTRA